MLSIVRQDLPIFFVSWSLSIFSILPLKELILCFVSWHNRSDRSFDSFNTFSLSRAFAYLHHIQTVTSRSSAKCIILIPSFFRSLINVSISEDLSLSSSSRVTKCWLHFIPLESLPLMSIRTAAKLKAILREKQYWGKIIKRFRLLHKLNHQN